MNYSNISNIDDMSFSEYLTKEAGIAVIPISPFYDKGDIQQNHQDMFCKTG